MMRCSGLDAFAYVLTLLALVAGCPQAYSHGCRRGMRYSAIRASYLRKLGIRALPTSVCCCHVGMWVVMLIALLYHTRPQVFQFKQVRLMPGCLLLVPPNQFVMVMGPRRPGRSCWALAVGAAWMGSATRLHLTHLIVKRKWKLL